MGLINLFKRLLGVGVRKAGRNSLFSRISSKMRGSGSVGSVTTKVEEFDPEEYQRHLEELIGEEEVSSQERETPSPKTISYNEMFLGKLFQMVQSAEQEERYITVNGQPVLTARNSFGVDLYSRLEQFAADYPIEAEKLFNRMECSGMLRKLQEELPRWVDEYLSEVYEDIELEKNSFMDTVLSLMRDAANQYDIKEFQSTFEGMGKTVLGEDDFKGYDKDEIGESNWGKTKKSKEMAITFGVDNYEDAKRKAELIGWNDETYVEYRRKQAMKRGGRRKGQ